MNRCAKATFLECGNILVLLECQPQFTTTPSRFEAGNDRLLTGICDVCYMPPQRLVVPGRVELSRQSVKVDQALLSLSSVRPCRSSMVQSEPQSRMCRHRTCLITQVVDEALSYHAPCAPAERLCFRIKTAGHYPRNDFPNQR